MAALVATSANGALLFDNGPVTDESPGGRCDQGPTGCEGSGTWTYYDNFDLTQSAVITGFDYTDWWDPGVPADYVQTNWTLWDSDPFTAAAPIASGSAVAAIAPTGPISQYLYTVDGLNENMPAGVYWLGINNTVLNGRVSTVATVAGVLPDARQSDGAGLEFDGLEDRAFRIYGVVPEPSTFLLAATGAIAGGGTRRRRR